MSHACSEWQTSNSGAACELLRSPEWKHRSFLVERVDHNMGCTCFARTETQFGVFLGYVLAHMLSKPIKYTVTRYAVIERG